MPGRDSLDDDSKFEALLKEAARIDDVPAPTATMQLVGKALGRFHIVGLLGKGGMGVVYRAEDPTLHRDVALKVVSPEAATDPERRRRLLQEARAAAAVGHANIAAVYEVGEAEGLMYIAMERVIGESLRERINRGPIPIEEAWILARQILDGLASAHDAGIIHRDLKPDNVMVDDQKRVKILDFGLAKFWRRDSEPGTALTEEGRLLGTPSYMSPEQAAGLTLDARSDVFSFGVLFYEMVTGEQAFQGANFLKILAAIERDEPPPISQKIIGFPSELEQIVQTCLSKEPSQRYTSARDVLEAIEKFEPSPLLSTRVRSPRSIRASNVTPSTANISLRPPAAVAPKPDRRTFLAIASIFMVLGFVTFFMRERLVSGIHAPEHSPSSRLTPPEMTSASAVTIPTTLADLPMPTTANADLVTAYKRGLSKYRTGDAWPETDLHRAIEIDREFAPAYLRLAVNWTGEHELVGRKRQNIQKAWEHSGRLSERDHAVLEAHDPLLRTQPANPAEYVRRMSALIERWPGDADLWLMRAIGHRRNDNIDAMIQDAERARELDPRFAVAYVVLGQAHSARGQVHQARDEYERCLKAIPAAAICMKGLALQVSMFEGQCKEVESLSRKMLSISPDWFEAYILLANAVATQRDTLAAAQEATVQWEKAFEESASTTYKNAKFLPALKLEYRAGIDILAGDFEASEAKRREAIRLRASSSMMEDHSEPLMDLLYVLQEEGRSDVAGILARDYLSRAAAWEPPGKGIDFTLPLMLNFARTGNAQATLSFEKQRDAWVAEASNIARSAATGRQFIWYVAYARVTNDANSARAAMEEMPKFQPLLSPGAWPSDLAFTGRVFFLAGHLDEAISWLERASRHCRALADPVSHVQAYAWLGQAREKKGDKPGACAAYSVVLEHWGHAKPRSVTADDTRVRMKALGCTLPP